jgi:predicted short-subunit dehydrogenase-like oxidoreductase (DUF2520 family)
MKVVLIGAGNVATVLGKLVKAAGHTIMEVVSRNRQHAQQLAALLETNFNDDFKSITSNADIYIIAVADDAISAVADQLRLDAGVVVHTSGAVSKEVLEKTSSNYGILYPLQSLRKETANIPVIPLLVHANNEAALNSIQSFAASVSGKVSVANDEQRLKLHVAAVVSANFSNHLYALTEEFCRKENTRFDMLIPLIQEVALRLNDYSAKDVQTGPALRNDKDTIEKHLQVLNNHPGIKKIYESFTESILSFYNK